MLSGRDIIFLSSIEWDFHWQVHQEIASRFAAGGNRVLFIENTGVRSPHIGDAGRVFSRLEAGIKSRFSRGVRQISTNLFVLSPFVAPPFGPLWKRELNRRIMLPRIARAIKKLGFHDPIVWTYLPTDTALELLNLLASPRSSIVYYCGADFSQLTDDSPGLRQSEEKLLQRADFVLTTCRQLSEHCQRHNSNVHIVPAGVNLELFKPEPDSELDVQTASFFTTLSKPIIGYVGTLHKFVDYELIYQMARMQPSWSWVFVGAEVGGIGDLRRLSNLHLLGKKPHPQLANYIRQFDVCLIPYINNASTATVVPLKLNEYLAVGKPVVSTELPAICEINKRYEVLRTAPNQAELFLLAIRQSITTHNDDDLVAKRRQVAALGEWGMLLERLSELLK